MIESQVLAQIDSFGATAIRNFVAQKYDHVTIGLLAYFIGVQFNRVPTMSKLISEIWEKGLTEMMRLATVSPERMQLVMEKYAKETGKALNVTAEAMFEAVRDGGIRVEATEVPFLKSMFKHAQSVAEVITQLGWQVLSAPDSTGFIICDHPVVVVPPRGGTDVGFWVPGTVSYFPLNRKTCLRLAGASDPIILRDVGRDAVRTINLNIAASSERFIMGPNETQLEGIVKRSGSVGRDAEPRAAIETVERDDDSSTQMSRVRPRRYFYGSDGAKQAP